VFELEGTAHPHSGSYGVIYLAEEKKNQKRVRRKERGLSVKKRDRLRGEKPN